MQGHLLIMMNNYQVIRPKLIITQGRYNQILNGVLLMYIQMKEFQRQVLKSEKAKKGKRL